MSKPAAVAGIAVCLGLAACGSGSKTRVGAVGDLGDPPLPSSTTTGAPAPTDAPGQPHAVKAPASRGPAGTLAPQGSPATPPPEHVGPRSNPGNSGFSGSLPPGADTAALGGAGSYARVLLHPLPAKSIQIELLEQSGAGPNQTALDYDLGMVRKVTQKPVAIGKTVPVPGGSQDWSPGAMESLVDHYGTRNVAGAPTAVLHLLFVHGQLANSPSTLGVAFRGDILAIFPDKTQGQVALNSDRTLEAIYTHETGHLMGMVDLALNDHRGDPNDPAQPSHHSPNKGSVMYYAVDTTGISTVFQGGAPTDFDSADYDDFAKLRSGA